MSARRGSWTRTIVIAGLVLVLLVPGVALLASGPPAAARPSVGAPTPLPPAVDPLRGSAVLGVPSYHVASGQLRGSPGPGYVSGTPVWLAYDPVDQFLWVAMLPNSVDVVNETGQVQGVFPVGSQPFDVAVNARSNLVYVTNTGSDNVSILNGTLPPGDHWGSLPPSYDPAYLQVPVGSEPLGVAYDPTSNEVYVANQGSNNVSVFNGTTGASVANIAVGFGPRGLAYDAATGQVFVADGGDFAVSVISTSIHAVVATIAVGSDPYGVAVDNRTDTVYVTNENSSNVSVISAPSDAVVGSILQLPSAPLQGIAFNAARNELWVGEGYYTLGVINATSGQFAYDLNTDPSGVAYDPTNRTVCFTNAGNYTYQCFSDPTTANFRAAAPVSIGESGLPLGTPWSVYVLNGPALNGSGRYINFSVNDVYYGPFTIVLRFAPSGGYLPSVGGAAFAASGTGLTTYNLSFARGSAYAVQFVESGLPPAVGWSVNVSGRILTTVGNSTELPMPNGSYSYSVDPPAGMTSYPASGNVTVAAAPVVVYPGFNATTYPVLFQETGLPTGGTWYVNFTSGPMVPHLMVVGPTGLVSLQNGSYAFNVSSADPNYTAGPGRTMNVSGGGVSPANATSVDFVLRHPTYPVLFNETGLPSGSLWQVTLNQTTQSATTTSTFSQIAFSEPDGVYRYAVVVPSGFQVNGGATGALAVSGRATGINLVVIPSAHAFNLTFEERGLANGTGWAVAIGSAVESSLAPNITFRELNGSYDYVLLAVSGYVSSSGGVATVHGGDLLVNVTFTLVTYPVIIVEFGLPASTNWSVTVTNLTRHVNVTETTNSTALVFFLSNGTYAIGVSAPGFNVTVSSPTFTVAGARANGPSAHFSPSQPGKGSTPPTAPAAGTSWWEWSLLGGAVAAVVAALAFVALRRRVRPT